MRLLMCLLIVALGAYIGRQFSSRTSQRLNFMSYFEAAMMHLTDKVAVQRLELEKCLGTQREGVIGEFFADCSRSLSDSPRRSFSGIWNGCFKEHAPSYLTKADIRTIETGGETMESLCMNPSERQAAAYLKRLSGYIEELQKEKLKKSKLYNTAGLLGGLLIALMMI